MPPQRPSGAFPPDSGGVGGELLRIKYAYDADANLVKLTDPKGNVTAFEYNRNNQLVKQTYADGRSLSFSYDGWLLSQVTNARGIITYYGYDSNNNLTSVTYSDDTPSVTNQYDYYNRRTDRRDGLGHYSYTYDNNSRHIGLIGPWENYTVTFQYDAADRRTGLQCQGGGSFTYDYDTLNRLTRVRNGSANAYSYSYSDAGPLPEKLTRPNNSVTDYQYDSLRRLTGITNKTSASAIINQYLYTYNQQDFRSTAKISSSALPSAMQSGSTSYTYNNVNQLLTAASSNSSFGYDEDGNMTQGYTAGGYRFNASYDAENRLKSLEYTDNTGVHRIVYQYDGNNFLGVKSEYKNNVLVGETRYIRYGSVLLQERDGNNNVIREYTWGLDQGGGGIGGLLNLNQAGQDYSYLYDGMGNVTALLDSLQSIKVTYDYDPFGSLMIARGTLDQPFRFSTKPYDDKTGLSYYGYRFYAAQIRRWLTRDPIGEEGGLNLYGFVENNPLNRIDPLGLQYTEDHGGGSSLNNMGKKKEPEKVTIPEHREEKKEENKNWWEGFLDRYERLMDWLGMTGSMYKCKYGHYQW